MYICLGREVYTHVAHEARKGMWRARYDTNINDHDINNCCAYCTIAP